MCWQLQDNDHVNAFGEGWFSDIHATNLIAQPAYNAAIFGQGGTLTAISWSAINNPFLSPGDRQLIQTALNNYGLRHAVG